jgi:hypothetical protein
MSVQDPFAMNADSFLGGAAVAAKWPAVGYVVEGTVVDWRMSHQTDYETSEPLYWVAKRMVKRSAITEPADLLNPVMQLIMNIQGKPTGETWEGLGNVRKALPNDDGARAVYIKGLLQTAFKSALRTAQAKLEQNAYVRIERIADGVQPDRKKQAPHDYKVIWTPAAQNPHVAQSFLDESDDVDPFAPKDKAPF